jgi:uncharacterized protein
LTSTNLHIVNSGGGWRAAGLRYHRFGFFLRQKFGCQVWKVSVDAGFGCPNRDGTTSTDGCRFCNDASFSPGIRQREINQLGTDSIYRQLEIGIEHIERRYPAERFLAYFQPATNTHGPIERLRAAYTEAINHPSVIGLVIGTRPDCLGPEVLDLLESINEKRWVSVEIGLQTIHNRTLDWLERGHNVESFYESFAALKKRGLHVGAHLILGLPGETDAHRLATVDKMGELGVDVVKFHHFHAVQGTRLADDYRSGRVEFIDEATYVDWVIEALERLPADCAVDRLSGDVLPMYNVAPAWSTTAKNSVRSAVDSALEASGNWQGRRFGRPN